jgi:pimeloyl-ACP methyl ester carboxylesterase
MRDPLPVMLVPGLLCSARLYAGQIAALWRFGPVTVADHRHDDTMEAIARRILDTAPPRFALAGLSMGGYIAFDRAAGAGTGRSPCLARYLRAPGHAAAE